MNFSFVFIVIKASKLAFCVGGSFLSDEDQNFVELVYEDIKRFVGNPRGER